MAVAAGHEQAAERERGDADRQREARPAGRRPVAAAAAQADEEPDRVDERAQPTDSASPAWPRQRHEDGVQACVSTSTATAILTGVRMSWRA